jgi:ferric-dicitrate binding protein FerR (iron transport regulator)
MKTDVEITDDLIYRYLAGEASPEEAIGINTWLATGTNRAHYLELKAIWDATNPGKKPRAINKEAAWNTLERRMPAKSRRATGTSPIEMPRRLVLAIAASLALILTCLTLVYLYVSNKRTDELALDSGNSIRKVSLPDGSAITLYHNSSITLPKQFAETERNIHLLRGEAFFSIAPDVRKPFTIHTSIANIRVIGTSFNVMLDEERVVVSIKDGKVLVHTPADSVSLEGGSAATFSVTENAFHVDLSVDPNEWGYATGKLTFDDTRLSEVARCIEKTYSCTIILKNRAIEDCKLTANFEDDSAQNILNLIAETLNLSVSQNGSVFTLEGEGCR